MKTLLLLFFVPFLCFAQNTISGEVVSVTDGDTFKLLTKDSTIVKVRLANIDCPERKQPFSQKAKQFTSDAIFGKYITIEELKRDRYGRSIANVFYGDSLNLSHELVRNGLAWHYVKYSNEPILQELEDKAKNDKIGLWQDAASIAPSEWRKRKRK
ncbi:thermonuclease family protein [Mangrovimonas sp. DI 80]|uniref:thermonuclease family protein n=1 Tax=Mangrovimonas sp. DI 80 TaxID=1779330 RepID=UPI00097761AA|nr:thermonuclease family protein [Mangrovimonas sp. DI 80]OMP29950.1 nuclease [Mangrovimonas sp. DI 80]